MLTLAHTRHLVYDKVMKEALTQTKDEWAKFSPAQKAAAISATALTVTRPILAVSAAARGLDRDRTWTSGDAKQLGIAYLTDLEGTIARTADAETALGGALDPIADKIASAAPEIVMASRGEESWTNVAIKLTRDLGISALRSHAQRNRWPRFNKCWMVRQSQYSFQTSHQCRRYVPARREISKNAANSTGNLSTCNGRQRNPYRL